jgi:plastocyanin
MKKSVLKVGFVICCLVFVGAAAIHQGDAPSVAQVVALDECDPTTFNAAIGPDFCKNVSLAVLGYATTIQDLFAKAAAGTPDPKWDFEPDTLSINKGTVVSVVDQGGEPHTFTEVKEFGTSQITGLSKGVHHFQCCLHPWMRVTVDVK